MRMPRVGLATAMSVLALAISATHVTAQSPTTSVEADNVRARAFRDEWMEHFEGKLPTMPPIPPGLGDPEWLEWRDFSLSLALLAKEVMVDPNRTVMPSAAGAISRTAIQLLLMALGGDNQLGGVGSSAVPRQVYDEQIADEQARARLEIVTQALRAYVGASEAEAFRTASPQAKVGLASRAALAMIEEQKTNWPNAVLLFYATNGRVNPEIIGKLLGPTSRAFAAFMREPSLRVRSMYVADGFAAMMKRAADVPLSGSEFDAFAGDVMEVRLARERDNPERAVLEALGKAGQDTYRNARGRDRVEIVNAAVLLKAIATMSWSFATFTPETIASFFPR